MIGIEFNATNGGLFLRSKGTPTMMLAGILKKAAKDFALVPSTRPDEDKKVFVDVVFDLETQVAVIQSNSAEVLVLGALGMAESMITQNQTLQRLQAAGATAKARLVGPDGGRIN